MSGGIPNSRARAHPHPGGQLSLPMHVIDRYERVRGEFVQQIPNVVRADPFFPYPRIRTQRAAAVSAIIGTDLNLAWSELLAARYDRFIDAFLCFLG